MNSGLRYFLSIALLLSHFETQAFHVVIDPGHGGADKGATRGPYKEANIALAVSQQVRDFFKLHPEMTVSLTREDDRTLSLPQRVSFAENNKADLLVSIHLNSNPNPRVKGVEFYLQNQLTADEDTLYLTAFENQSLKNISERDLPELSKKTDVLTIIEDLKRQDRLWKSYELSQAFERTWKAPSKISLKQAPFYVISRTNVPSILIELGFLTNPQEAQDLSNPIRQRELAESIYQGLVSYYKKTHEMSDKTLAQSLE